MQTITLSRTGKSDDEYISDLESAISKLSMQTEMMVSAIELTVGCLASVAVAYEESEDKDGVALEMYQTASETLALMLEDEDEICH